MYYVSTEYLFSKYWVILYTYSIAIHCDFIMCIYLFISLAKTTISSVFHLLPMAQMEFDIIDQRKGMPVFSSGARVYFLLEHLSFFFTQLQGFWLAHVLSFPLDVPNNFLSYSLMINSDCIPRTTRTFPTQVSVFVCRLAPMWNNCCQWRHPAFPIIKKQLRLQTLRP